MQVIHVVSGITDDGGGPSYSVPKLCESLISAGLEVKLATLDWPTTKANLPYINIFPFGLGPRRLGSSPKMGNWLKQEVLSGRVEIIHNHGLWMMPNVYSGRAVKNSRCYLVVSPRGTLSSYALGRNALQKNIFWHFFQAPVMQKANCFHATALSEYDDIRRRGYKQPVCILPNGIDVPPLVKKPNNDRKRLLFLGRIHPIKGIDNLLHAWQRIQDDFLDWDLHIAGPDNGGYLGEMQELVKKLNLKRVVFIGPLFGEQKLQAYREASIYILPTYSENFGMTVAEALSVGTPAIVTHGAPWAGLVEHDAGWWVEIGVEPLVSCLKQALSTPPERIDEMGNAGREWMKSDFSWEGIGQKLMMTYRWLIDGGEKPDWVKLD